MTNATSRAPEVGERFSLDRQTPTQIVPHFYRTGDITKTPVEIKCGTLISVTGNRGSQISATIVGTDCYGSIGIKYVTDPEWPVAIREIASLRFRITALPSDIASSDSPVAIDEAKDFFCD